MSRIPKIDPASADRRHRRPHGRYPQDVRREHPQPALNVFTNYLNNVAETKIDFPEVSLFAAA